MVNILMSLVINTKTIHDALQRDFDNQFLYFHFNIEYDINNIDLKDWKKMHVLRTYTVAYMSIYESKRRKIIYTKYLIDLSVFYRN